MSLSLLEAFQLIFLGNYESGEHVATALRLLDKGMSGGLRSELESFTADELLVHVKQGLEQNGAGERFPVFEEGIRLFIKP
jgi:hypothetical protein